MADWVVQREDGRIEEGSSREEREGVEWGEEVLSDPQLRAIDALVVGATVSAAAERAGVNRATLHRWLNSPRFVAGLNLAKREHRSAVRGELRAMAGDALNVLREVLTSQKGVSALRVRIALGILKAVGADEPELIGSSDPDGVRKEMVYRDRIHKLRTVMLVEPDQ